RPNSAGRNAGRHDRDRIVHCHRDDVERRRMGRDRKSKRLHSTHRTISPAPPQLYPLSMRDALPIFGPIVLGGMLVGTIVTGLFIAIAMTSSGGPWEEIGRANVCTPLTEQSLRPPPSSTLFPCATLFRSSAQ